MLDCKIAGVGNEAKLICLFMQAVGFFDHLLIFNLYMRMKCDPGKMSTASFILLHNRSGAIYVIQNNDVVDRA